MAVWSYTPAEIAEALEGAVERERARRELVAWQTAHVINISGKSVKRDVKLKALMREVWQRDGEERVVDPVAKFEALWARHEERVNDG